MAELLGNEQNMAEVQRAMAEAQAEKTASDVGKQVEVGSKATEGVSINYQSDSGKLYTGQVVFRRPNAVDFMRMGGIKSEMLRLGGVKDIRLVDASIAMLAHSVAHIEVLAVKRPEWLLNPRTMEDLDVIMHVYGQYEVWERSFRQAVPGTPAGDTGASAN